jgi:ATP-dependent DNA helicase RecG
MLLGVGPERAAQLERLKIFTAGDLLLHRPNRYEDRRHFLEIGDLKLKEPATVRGKIVAQGLKYFRGRSKSVFEFILDDGTARLHCRWWNLPFMEKYFEVGDDVMVFGKPVSVRPRTMDHPETEVLDPAEDISIHLDRIVPIYPLTEGLPQRWLRSLAWRTLHELEAQIAEPFPEVLALTQNKIPTRANAVHMLHFPEEMPDAELARQRLALDEFLAIQVEMQRRRRNLEAKARAPLCPGTNELMKPFLARLPFQLTDAQTRVLRDIRKDMSGSVPMRRLLQGDVGAGKTVVAACGALMAIESGHNVALMAPTEILAEQHFTNFHRWLEPLGVRVALQTGAKKVETRESKGERQDAARFSTFDSRRSTLFIGTHALITPAFDMENLGLVIIDEQHKFGVAQREQLVRKGSFPHLLVMTATPIPRTLGLTLYGDLDSSVLDELPPGRGRVRTFVRTREQLPKVYEFMRGKLTEGRQAFVVYARVSEADTDAGIKAVTVELDTLRKEFPKSRVGLLHGRIAAPEKEQIMTDFRANKLQVLLATSVIEVGVDVPNATVMVIENAEQFGLAQLHQLRGRIGRGAHESFCILVADLKTPQADERLRVMERTNDGFAIAEADLNLRGPGEFLGAAQSGLPPFQFGDIIADARLLETSRQIARQIVKQ